MAEIRQFSFWWKNLILIGRLCRISCKKKHKRAFINFWNFVQSYEDFLDSLEQTYLFCQWHTQWTTGTHSGHNRRFNRVWTGQVWHITSFLKQRWPQTNLSTIKGIILWSTFSSDKMILFAVKDVMSHNDGPIKLKSQRLVFQLSCH